MNGEHWRRAEDLFHRVADLPPAERSPLLARECANDEKLLRDVEALLAHDTDSKDVIGGAVGRAAGQLPEGPGRRNQLLGKHVGGYVITELLGEGGMGMVFKALDTRLNRSVAIKVLPPDSFADSERKRRFLQEARSASALNHPSIVTIYGIVEEEGMDFIVMEYVPGKTLDDLTPTQRPAAQTRPEVQPEYRRRPFGGAQRGDCASRHQAFQHHGDQPGITSKSWISAWPS